MRAGRRAAGCFNIAVAIQRGDRWCGWTRISAGTMMALPNPEVGYCCYRFFARPANGLSEVRSAMRIGTPGMSNESRRLLTR